jgi:hypothetical protein
MVIRIGQHVAKGGERLLGQNLERADVVQREMLVLRQAELPVRLAALLVERADIVEREQAGHGDPDQSERRVGLNRELVFHAGSIAGLAYQFVKRLAGGGQVCLGFLSRIRNAAWERR